MLLLAEALLAGFAYGDWDLQRLIRWHEDAQERVAARGDLEAHRSLGPLAAIAAFRRKRQAREMHGDPPAGIRRGRKIIEIGRRIRLRRRHPFRQFSTQTPAQEQK